mgnify:CR=1 FL=1
MCLNYGQMGGVTRCRVTNVVQYHEQQRIDVNYAFHSAACRKRRTKRTSARRCRLVDITHTEYDIAVQCTGAYNVRLHPHTVTDFQATGYK